MILISEKNEASYKDVVAPDGEFLIYTGHNAHRSRNTPLPQLVDQPERHRSGTLTQNGRFAVAAERYRGAEAPAEPVQVYKNFITACGWISAFTISSTGGKNPMAGDRFTNSSYGDTAPRAVKPTGCPSRGVFRPMYAPTYGIGIKAGAWFAVQRTTCISTILSPFQRAATPRRRISSFYVQSITS
ncbi:MAG: hypothetical protein M5R36_22980 [Deltaproteobacteria bacterium]|nr:hypothetical protein [Deltaproteobacteria bacterium]